MMERNEREKGKRGKGNRDVWAFIGSYKEQKVAAA